MQGLWSTHRRNKLNLNSPASPGAPTPVTPSADDPATPRPPETSNLVETPAPTNTEQDIVNGKRKLRTRAVEGSSKRSKILPSGSGGLIPKEHASPTARLSDLGGVELCIEKLLELVAMPLCHPEVYLHTGVQPPRGVLLHGPPGCGKTLLAHAMAGVCRLDLSIVPIFNIPQELGIPFISISAPTIVSGMSGESEKTLRDMFEEAKVSVRC